jgi:hypothetical protein
MTNCVWVRVIARRYDEAILVQEWIASFLAMTHSVWVRVIARRYDEAISVQEWIALFLAINFRSKKML